jgi:putative membrane protein
VGIVMWDDDRSGRYYMHDGMGWGGWLVMTVVLILLLTLVVLAFLALFRGTGSFRGPAEQDRRRRSSADEILDERFARGEIDEEEYRRRREALRSG